MRRFVQALLVSGMLLGAAAPVSARADFWDWLFGSFRDRQHQGGGHHGGGGDRSAPAPLTLAGLGLGAGGIAMAAWLRSKRRSR